MPVQPQIFSFPSKGVNRLGARSAQPPGTAWDMLNVMPTDGFLRIRGGKRNGTVKLWDDPLGEDGPDAILLLDQVTLITPAPPSDTVIFFDSFAYSGGELNSVSSGVWDIVDGALGNPSTDVIVASSSVTITGSNSGNEFLIMPDSVPALDLTAGYSMEMTCETSLENAQAVGMSLETDETDWFVNGPMFSVDLSTDGAVWTMTFAPRGSTFTPSVDYFTGDVTATMTSPATVKVTVSAGTGSSRTAQVFLNDVQIGGFDCPLPASDTHINFIWTMTESTTTVPPTLDDVTLTQSGGSSPTSIPVRTTKIIAVANRDIYEGDINTQATLTTGGENLIAKHVLPGGAYSAGKYYFVDGTDDIKQLDVATSTMESYTDSAGSHPEKCTLACMWRDRLVLAAPTGNEQEFFMSRVGDQHDWDYNPADPLDPARAFAGQDSTAGHIGEPIKALMPMSDDLLAIAGDHNLWVVRGDPADNGSIDLVSNTVGILGPKAWCQDPNGSIYFLGTFGLYKWDGNGPTECLSDESYPAFFSGLDRARFYIELAWDRDQRGIYIFLLESNSDTPPVSIFWSAQTGGFFPLQFPNGHGPTSCLVYDGDAPADRKLLMGGKDGFVRSLKSGVFDDDGNDIEWYVDYAPIVMGDQNNDGILQNLNVTLGDPASGITASDFGVDVTVRAGLTAYDVTEGSSTAKLHTFNRRYDGMIGRLNSLRQKVRGVFGAIRLSDTSSDKTCVFETISVDIEPAGRTRR